MKKNILVSLILSGTILLTGCASTGGASSKVDATSSVGASSTVNDAQEKISIVAATFPEYDWTREILGDKIDNFDLDLLIDSGVDLHSYQPSVQDIAKISSADLFIHNGGESDGWATDAVKEPANKNLVEVNLMELLGDSVKEEVQVEGMEEHHHDHDHEHEEDADHDHEHEEDADHDHEHEEDADHDHEHEEDADHEHEEDADHDHEHEHEYDEHIWLSINNAIDICESLVDEISNLDPENKDVYKANGESYIKKLQELDNKFEQDIENAARDTVVITDRFPFLYLMEDYDIKYYAAFSGCSAETEASFETIAFLAEKVNELDIKKLIIIDNGLEQLANTVAQNSNNKDCEILKLNSMQSVSNDDIKGGTSYYSIMENNLDVIMQALEK